MKNTITKLGAERLRRVADEIELTGRFNYGAWGEVRDPDGGLVGDDLDVRDAHEILHRCDTVGCVAGWGVAFAMAEGFLDRSEASDWEHDAENYFQLGDGAANNLFYGEALVEARLGDGTTYMSFIASLNHQDRDWDKDERLAWVNAEPTEVAKMMRSIADGQHPTWEVVDG